MLLFIRPVVSGIVFPHLNKVPPLTPVQYPRRPTQALGYGAGSSICYQKASTTVRCGALDLANNILPERLISPRQYVRPLVLIRGQLPLCAQRASGSLRLYTAPSILATHNLPM